MTSEVPEIIPATPRSATVEPATDNIEAPPPRRESLEVGGPRKRGVHITEADPKDAWLPITGSRNGNAYYAAFHMICSGLGFQALAIPLAFVFLGWAWGIIILSLAFIWQLYTIWVLIQLHESTDTGVRYSRYLHLFRFAYGKRLTNIVALFPIIYLSVGTCIMLIITGGSTLGLFLRMVCVPRCDITPLTPTLRYLVFTCGAVVLSQLRNLNTLAGVSLIGAVTGIAYCTMTWIVSVTERRHGNEVNVDEPVGNNALAQALLGLFSIGLIFSTFRGHNLILEIQATMPSNEQQPSRVPMWKGVKFAYILIAFCLFPLAIAGYWSLGVLVSQDGGLLLALDQFLAYKMPPYKLGLISLLVILSTLSSFPIYAMPVFDLMESPYATRMNKPCKWCLRAILRTVFGFFCFFIAVAIPTFGTLNILLLGAMVLPVTLAYPCFMWIKIKKPKVYGLMWWINWGLGILGMALTIVLVVLGVLFVVTGAFQVNFFNPN